MASEDPRVLRARAEHQASERARAEARQAANSAGHEHRVARDLEIQSLWADGGWTHESLAAAIGVGERTVRLALKRA